MTRHADRDQALGGTPRGERTTLTAPPRYLNTNATGVRWALGHRAPALSLTTGPSPSVHDLAVGGEPRGAPGAPAPPAQAPPGRAALDVLFLCTDAYGGYGGIAQYNRDLLDAFGEIDAVRHVHVLPRAVSGPLEPVPPTVRFDTRSAGSTARFVLRALAQAASRPDLVVCAHLNLLPVAVALKKATGARLALGIYGIDAWTPPSRPGTGWMLRQLDAVYSISDFTLGRFAAWAPVADVPSFVLPNAVHLEDYAAGEKSPVLLDCYGLRGKTVLMTTGRMDARERYKGFDQTLGALARLAPERPDLAYVVVGKGDDQPRIEALAASLGVRDRVVFTGFVDEAAKADHFRLADAYVMPSDGEGFGFVFLEALACGVPCVGSDTDGGREALRLGSLGRLVRPDDEAALDAAVLEALAQPKGVPAGLAHFAFPRFVERADAMLREVAR